MQYDEEVREAEPFFGGVPTKPDVQALKDKFSVPKE